MHRVVSDSRDLSGLKAKIGTARDYVILVGTQKPYLWKTDNRTLFIGEIQKYGCNLPERSIDRAIRNAKQFMGKFFDVDIDRADSMEMDHRIVYGDMQ